jgi:hypothetical protein
MIAGWIEDLCSRQWRTSFKKWRHSDSGGCISDTWLMCFRQWRLCFGQQARRAEGKKVRDGPRRIWPPMAARRRAASLEILAPGSEPEEGALRPLRFKAGKGAARCFNDM